MLNSLGKIYSFQEGRKKIIFLGKREGSLKTKATSYNLNFRKNPLLCGDCV